MAEELETARQQLDDHESQSLTSLRARVSALRDEGAAVSRALRDGEARALDGWREAVTRMEESEAEALDRILAKHLRRLGKTERDAWLGKWEVNPSHVGESAQLRELMQEQGREGG